VRGEFCRKIGRYGKRQLMIQKKRLTLAAVYFTFFVDNVSWSIVFPIFAPYFLDQNNQLFSPEVSLTTRTTLLGLFLMAFSLGQFLGAPVIGEYADKHGRRKALCMSVFFTLVGVALSAWGIEASDLYLLFFGRLVTGVFASNLSLCLASVADLSETEAVKVKRFGYLSVLAGLSFVMGAFVGGKLSDPAIDADFRPNIPLWIATGLALLNYVFVLWGFKETHRGDAAVRFSLLECFKNLGAALKTEKIKRIYSIYFLFIFAWTMLFQFTPVVVVRKFEFTNSNIADLALFMGLCWAIGSGYLNKLLIRYFPAVKILQIALLLFMGLCLAIAFLRDLEGALFAIGLCVVLGGLAWPLCTGVISNAAPPHIQGKILGISQSVQSLAMAVAPVVGGALYRAGVGVPFLLAAGACAVAIGVYWNLQRRTV
jgi:DHA1 family tetracycline resistance protein-like MFS transporter